MFSWPAIGVIATLFTVVGVAFDRLILLRHKKTIHLRLVEWWNRLDETLVPDLASLVADWTLSRGKQILRWPLFSWQMAAIIFCASLFATSGACVLGLLLEGWNSQEGSPIPLPIFTVYITNLLFDLPTVWITIHILRYVRSHTTLKAVLAITADILLAATLAIFCYGFNLWSEDVAVKHSLPGSKIGGGVDWEDVKESFTKNSDFELQSFTESAQVEAKMKADLFWSLMHSPALVLSTWTRREVPITQVEIHVLDGRKYVIFTVEYNGIGPPFFALMAGTTFVPTAMYMIVLLVFALGKIVLGITRYVAMYLLEVMSEKDPAQEPKDFMPGTLVGILAAVLAAFAKAVVTISEFTLK